MPVTWVLLFGEGCSVVLLRPGTLDALSTCHARIWFIDKRKKKLTELVVSIDMQFRNTPTNNLHQLHIIGETTLDPFLQLLRELTPNVIAD